MRRTCLSVALALTVLTAGAAFAAAEDAAPATPQVNPDASTERNLLPQELQQLLTPAPEVKAPIVRYAAGPCSITVTCRYSGSVSCSSPAGSGCTWQLDYSPMYPGWVTCGSYHAACDPLA